MSGTTPIHRVIHEKKVPTKKNVSDVTGCFSKANFSTGDTLLNGGAHKRKGGITVDIANVAWRLVKELMEFAHHILANTSRLTEAESGAVGVNSDTDAKI